MKTVNLYRYKNSMGQTIVSPDKPPEDISYDRMYRLVAEEGMMLTNDHENWYYMIDVESKKGWVEEEHVIPDDGGDVSDDSSAENTSENMPESEAE